MPSAVECPSRRPCPGIVEVAREALSELLWPTRCVVCDEPGELVCGPCRHELPWIAQRHACPNCGAPFGALTCTECASPQGESWETRSVVCALPLEGPGRALALAHKDAGERRLAPVIAAVMACALDEASAWTAADGLARFDAGHLDAVCFVPATRAAVVRRGFDHMEVVARTLAGLLGLPLLDALARTPARDQRSLGRSGRLANAEGTVAVVEDVAGLSLLLADDVVTTGSTMRACARALVGRAAEPPVGCALCRAW